MDIPDDLRTQVRDYVSTAQQTVIAHGNTMTERETEAWLVEPMLDVLQWNKGPDVRIGYPIKTKNKRYIADYALQIESKTRALIEVKRVANNLNDEDVLQLMEYAFHEKADVFILTNGNEWRVYEPYHLKDLVFSVNLEDMEDNLDSLWLLSRHSIVSGLLKKELNRRYTIDRVYEYIQENRDGWIRDIVGTSTGLTPDGVSRMLDKTIRDKAMVLSELSPKLPPPVIDPPIPDVEWASIADNHTGKSISSFWFNGSAYAVESWRQMLLQLSSIIYSAYADEFDKVLTIKGRKRSYYTRNEDDLISPVRIPDTDILVEGNQSANSASRICRQLIAAFDYSDDDLKVQVHGADDGGDKPGEDTLDGKYSGQYAHLRPVFDAIESKVMEFGDDVKLNVRKMHTAFMRKYCFVILTVTKQAINIGLSLDDSVEYDRLNNTPNWGGWSRVNRSLEVSSVEDIDDQLVEWMKQAYDRS